MRRTIYLQMLYIINMYRSWIVVDDGWIQAKCRVQTGKAGFLRVPYAPAPFHL